MFSYEGAVHRAAIIHHYLVNRRTAFSLTIVWASLLTVALPPPMHSCSASCAWTMCVAQDGMWMSRLGCEFLIWFLSLGVMYS